MKLKRVQIKNFRKLASIDFSIDKNVTVIVGPNAVGKSSIFEAIRLAKAILFARQNDELRNVLISLGATSAHYFNQGLQYDFGAIAGDVTQSTKITLNVSFSETENIHLRASRDQLARNFAMVLLGRPLEDPMFDLRQYFGTDQGKKAYRDCGKAIDDALKQIGINNAIELSVEITERTIETSVPVFNLLVAHIEQTMPPDKALFSYFPADRSLPQGEVPIQIGPQDFKANVDSHFALAQNKYGRLKQSIVARSLLATLHNEKFDVEFNDIFQTLLPGKRYVGLKQSQIGLLSVQVHDSASNRVIDIDSLSSGEKGLILSFLLFSTATANGSVVFVDEPELHLNPAVCKKIIPYLADKLANATDCQFIISTHSAEVMTDAFERDDCQLFHLRNPKDISPVLRRDGDEVRLALDRLGVSTAQILTSRGTIFVEGETDSTLLEAGFPDHISGYLVKKAGGRGAVISEIDTLQKAELKGALKDFQVFIFDNDGQTIEKPSSDLVKVEQLTRHCIENYLLDEELLWDALKELASHPPESRGSFNAELRELAMNQLDAFIAKDLINQYLPPRSAPKKSDAMRNTFDEAAALHLGRLKATKVAIEGWVSDGFEARFVSECRKRRDELLPIWESSWKEKCDGKILFKDLYRKYEIGQDEKKFKSRIMKDLARSKHDSWSALKSILERAITR
jgi:predicted ATPase